MAAAEAPSPSHGKENHTRVQVSFAEDMNAKARSTMEDAHAIVDKLGGDPHTGFFGVYDGHGGRGVAEYLRGYLHVAVANELKRAAGRSVEECITAAFMATDVACAESGDRESGSTAVTCLVRNGPTKHYIYTANCGDARAVLCENGKAIRLSKDHKATDESEKARIQAAGGFVMRGRVLGVLAVARSFGDYALKKFVPCEPFIGKRKITSMTQFIIIACDGIWDVMTDQDAVDRVREKTGGTRAPPNAKASSAAKCLVDFALSRGSADNVTAMVVFF